VFGASLYDAMKTNDWSSVADAIVQPLTDMITSKLGGLGGFGGVIGGFLGAAIGDLFGGGGLFGGKKKQRGDSISNPVITSDINAQRLLTELLNATKVGLLQRAQGIGRVVPLRTQTVLIGE